MKRLSLILLCILAISAAAGSALSAETPPPGGAATPAPTAPPPPLIPQTPIVLPRAPGRFDYMQVDDKFRRLLIAHTGSRTFDVVDLADGSVVRQLDVGEARGIAVDERDGKYFVGVSRPTLVTVIQRKYMVKDNQLPTAGPIDAIAFDSKNDMLYADRADNGSVVVINGKSNKYYTSIAVGGDLEYVVYDRASDRIYQNVNSNGTIAVIDPNTNSVVSVWHAAPAVELTGLAVDGATHRLFSAGSNGKLAVIDATSGTLITIVTIAPNVDQIAFDPIKRRLYCASGAGLLSVVQETDAGAELLADITVPRHAHTVAVDPTTHAVWISYGALDNDYIMKLVPPQ